MRAGLLFIGLVVAALGSRGEAKPAPRGAGPRVADMVSFEEAPMPRRRSCYGPATWHDILACERAVDPRARVAPAPSAHTQLVIVPERGRHLFAQRPSDGKWVLARQLDEQTQIAGERAITIDKRAGFRVELRQQASLGTGVLRVKEAVVCGAGEDRGCTTVTYACSWIEHGRTRAVLLGEVQVTAAGVAVEADRSQAVGTCAR